MQRNICIDRLRSRALHHRNDPAYFSEIEGQWVATTWRQYHNKVQLFAKSLLSLDLAYSAKIAILGFNKLEWLISCMGSQYAGCISVGIYTSSSAEEVAYIVDHCDAEILIVENLERFNKQIKPEINKLNKLKLVVLMSDENCSDERMENFKTFLDRATVIKDQDLEARQRAIKAEDIATMIYTSGTTGSPKSVMLSHASIAWTVKSVISSWHCGLEDRCLSYLPLAHIAEQMITIYGPIECGLRSYFATSMNDFQRNLRQVEPTLLFGVPRVYEKIYENIAIRLKEQSFVKQKFLSLLSKYTRAYHQAQFSGIRPSFLLRTMHKIAVKKIFQSIKNQIGFGKVRLCACGAAPISKDILLFLSGFDIPIYEVFGQSENCGPATLNLPGFAKIGSVGRVLPGSEIRIADDGEILIRGPHVFSGYYKDQKATNEALKDGWLYSGDIGKFIDDDFLIINDRKKDLLITAGGKNISPQNLESMLKHLPYVQSAVVVGDSKKYLCALLAPDIESLNKKAQSLGVNPEQALSLVHNSAVQAEIDAKLAQINKRLAPVEQIKKYALLSQEFSIDTGEFTPTLKVKRKFVNQKYQAEINSMYQVATT